MRILHVYKEYFPIIGGIENHIKLLAEAQSARGHQVSVLVTSGDRHSRLETINRIRVLFAARLLTVSATPISLTLLRWLRRERADVVHLHSPYPWGELGNHCFGRCRTTVLTYHSDIVRQRYLGRLYAPLLHRVLARVDTIIATSPNYLASSPVLQRWRPKCVVVPLGIEPRRFATADTALASTVRQGARGPEPVALFVGVLRYYKGLQYVLHALTAIPDLRLIVVGTGPMAAAWRQLANRLDVSERVSFVGTVSQETLTDYYAGCDLLVLPSSHRSEAFGLVQLEAMAAGKPVVCTDVGTGTSFVNLDGVTGFVVRPRDAGALAAAMRTLIADPLLRARMGAAGQARVRQHFTADAMADGVLSAYEGATSHAG